MAASTVGAARWRLRFALQLAYSDNLDEYSDGRWLDLRDNVWRFLGNGLPIAVGELIVRADTKTSNHQRQFKQDDYRELQRKVVELFDERFIDAPDRGAVIPWVSKRGGGTTEFSALVLDGSPSFCVVALEGGLTAFTKTGEPINVFLEVLGLTLASLDTSRVKLCPECKKRLFYKEGRKKFCSEKCRAARNYRVWSADKKNREKKLEADREGSHRRYKERVQRTKGKNVKVQRKPRKGAKK